MITICTNYVNFIPYELNKDKESTVKIDMYTLRDIAKGPNRSTYEQVDFGL